MAQLQFFPPSFPIGIGCHSNVLAHPMVEEELKAFYEQRPDWVGCLCAAYRQRLLFLSEHIGQETKHRQWFEMLKDAKPYRSMRFNHVKLVDNLRIIYCVKDDKAYLLVAFKEKKKSDYDAAIELAKKRIPF